MSPANFSHAWFTEAYPASLAAPDAVTDESWQICSSSIALFHAQPSHFQVGRVDDDNSSDVFSTCVPNILTEFVFLFI
jgi:hypothetical protein